MTNSSKSDIPRRRLPSAPHADQIDALVGMLLESAKIMHGLMGGAPDAFDYDNARDRFYDIASSPAGTSSTSDRYRRTARRGIHRSRSTAVDTSVDGLPPCEKE